MDHPNSYQTSGYLQNGKVMGNNVLWEGNGPSHIPKKLVLLEIGLPQKQCWIAIGSPIFKKRLAFFFENTSRMASIQSICWFPNMINTMEYYRIVICLCSNFRPLSFSPSFVPELSHMCPEFSLIFPMKNHCPIIFPICSMIVP